jgi:nucleoside-diphosphate-sugar epimerase
LPFKEVEPVVPSTVYGLSKLYAEKLGQLFAAKTEMEIVNLRLARLFGYGERESVVFTKYMKLAIDKEPLEIWGEGATKIDFLYVKDAISGIERSLSQNIESGIYNLGSNYSYSVVEIAEIINRICQNEGNIRFLNEKTESKYYIQMDSSKFYNATDWSPSWTLASAVADHFKIAMKNDE